MDHTLSMDPEAVAKRLGRLYARTTDSERRAGVAWYERANDTIAGMARDSGYDIPTVARVVAVLSPNNRWASNIAAARLCLALHGEGAPSIEAFGRCGTYNVNVRKAWEIMEGDASALSGPKVTAFAANLMGDLDFLTLDSWAIRAARGWTRADFRNGTGSATPGRFRRQLEDGYRLAARRAGIPLAHFQAILWVHVRGGAD